MNSIRTCLVCRKRANKPELCRFVRAVDGEIRFDETGVLPNRGAWICADKSCILKAFHKRLLFKGERVLPFNAEAMMAHVHSRLKKSSLAKLGFLKKLGHLEAGKDAVFQCLKNDKVEAVLLAKDLSDRSKNEVMNKLKEKKGSQVIVSSLLMDEIGQSLGRKQTGVVGLLKCRITNEALWQFNKFSKLEP